MRTPGLTPTTPSPIFSQGGSAPIRKRFLLMKLNGAHAQKKRYAVVGTGGRVVMFLDPIASSFKDTSEIVGLCDLNPIRLNYHTERLREKFGLESIPVFQASDFDLMLTQQKPDAVIVCTVDATHDDYIVRALDAGCDVITEKPLTTDAAKCARIMEAAKRTGKSVRVAFNMRWMPGTSTVKRLIVNDVIGSVKSIIFEYTLDTKHGADYFRRWHSEKAKSGGLLVHKSTHHFDLANWWMDAIPETVFAFGDLAFYGRENAYARGQSDLTTYDRYTGHAPDTDPFKLDMEQDATMRRLYLDAEATDGYIRDRNVFRDGIDIEDSLSVVVKYRTGALLTYSLTAFCPSEGFRVTINGDRGRIEYVTHFKSHIIRGDSGDGSSIAANEKGGHQKIIVQPMFEPAYEVPIPIAEGSHGGGDPLLQQQIFGPAGTVDEIDRDAGHEQGAASASIGFAANQSIRSGEVVQISDLVDLQSGSTRLSALV